MAFLSILLGRDKSKSNMGIDEDRATMTMLMMEVLRVFQSGRLRADPITTLVQQDFRPLLKKRSPQSGS